MSIGRDGGIEDQIMDDIASNTGDNFDNEPSTEGDEPNTSAEPEIQPEERVPEPKAPKQQGKEAAPKGKQPAEKKPEAPKRDAKGNIIDDKGNIVAKGGVERRLHQQNERLKEAHNSAQTKIADLTRQLNENNSLNGLPKQYGLDTRDVGEAFRIAGAFKRSPVEGARMALEFALSQGASLNEIVAEEALPNISLAAQRRMMEELHQKHNGPIEQERKAKQEMDASNEQANRFAIQYPDAEEHHEDIAKLIPEIINQGAGQGRRIDVYTAAEMALQRLQNFAMQNGLDPNRAIGPQIEAIKANGGRPPNRTQQRVPQNNPNARLPTPPRRQAPMGNGSRGVDQQPSSSGSFSPNTSSDVIVREAMRSAGMKI